jgi:hypothetical protein
LHENKPTGSPSSVFHIFPLEYILSEAIGRL